MEVPPKIHLICLPPLSIDSIKYNLEQLAITHSEFEVKVHTKVPDNFVFKDLPVYGPAQLSALLRYDILRREGGWYLDLDVHVHCHLKELEKMLGIKKFTVSQIGAGVCTFVSCCPENWSGWDSIVEHMLANPQAKPGHYCTGALGRLLKKKPILCDFFPSNFVHSNMWLSHKGLIHENLAGQ